MNKQRFLIALINLISCVPQKKYKRPQKEFETQKWTHQVSICNPAPSNTFETLIEEPSGL